MARMQRAGYATFAWDKPGTGESTGKIDRSRIFEQRSRIVLDAVALLAERSDIDPERIGLWGISQAGWVMARVLERSDKIAFMIAISCSAGSGLDQGAYLLTAQAVCAGLPEKEAQQLRRGLAAAGRARTYEEYVRHKGSLPAHPALEALSEFGFRLDVAPREKWHADDPNGEYFFDPMPVIERTRIPVLAFFGEKDTQVDPHQGAQAYREALERAGNPQSRVELIPGGDHNILVSKTGCIEERNRRSRRGWRKYAPGYLDTLEKWLEELRP
jgi:pimeloyl-ACP methyl ester carboxylesterase